LRFHTSQTARQGRSRWGGLRTLLYFLCCAGRGCSAGLRARSLVGDLLEPFGNVVAGDASRRARQPRSLGLLGPSAAGRLAGGTVLPAALAISDRPMGAASAPNLDDAPALSEVGWSGLRRVRKDFDLRGRGRRRERSGKASIPGPRLEGVWKGSQSHLAVTDVLRLGTSRCSICLFNL
jgi:hypothetical protein